MTDKLRDDLLKRADEIDPVLEVDFDTQRCVEQDPCGATEAIEKALYLIRDMRAALAAAPQPAWVGPGETPHEYSPDYRAMGDCRICGHDWRAHMEKPQLSAAPQPAVAEREALAKLIWDTAIQSGDLMERETAYAIADALLARGLRLPGEEAMAWAVVDPEGRIEPDTVNSRKDRVEDDQRFGERVCRVAIRVVEGGDDAE